MNLESCFICALPVLELKGQFDKLDSYYLQPNDDAYVQRAYGWCHALCLVGSRWGAFWFTRRRKHFTENIGYAQTVSTDEHCVLRHPRTGELMVLRHDGLMFDIPRQALTKTKPSEGGVTLAIEQEMNIELDEADLVKEIRAQLLNQKRFPLRTLIDGLGISERMLFPAALAKGELRLDNRLRREWIGNWISAKAVYGRFLPNQVMALVQMG